MAVQNPLTSNPLITVDASKTNIALITKVNKPRVKMLIGKVKTISIGFKIKLTNPKNNASHKAVQILATVMPGIIYALIIIAKLAINHFSKISINLC